MAHEKTIHLSISFSLPMKKHFVGSFYFSWPMKKSFMDQCTFHDPWNSVLWVLITFHGPWKNVSLAYLLFMTHEKKFAVHFYFSWPMKQTFHGFHCFSWPMKKDFHGIINFSWPMKITWLKFHGNFMALISAMKFEISIFMAMKPNFMVFSLNFHGFFMVFKSIVCWVGNFILTIMELGRNNDTLIGKARKNHWIFKIKPAINMTNDPR